MKSRRARRPSAAPREAILGLDKLERNLSYFGAVIAVISSLLFIPHLLKNTWITDTAKPSKSKTCATGYKLVASLCEKHVLTHPSYWWPQFGALLVIGLFIALFAWRNKRTGVIVASILLGLASGVAGILFLALGAWLLIRAFRLQRYGDATFRGSNDVARARGRASREKRPARGERGARTAASSEGAPKPPAPSKRYTPKKRSSR